MDAAQRSGHCSEARARYPYRPQEAIHLVSQHVGVAIVTRPASVGPSAEGVVMRPLADPVFVFRDVLDYESRRRFAIGERFRPIISPKMYTAASAPDVQLTLPLPA